jgi:osmotically-inducible protein OsmY
VDEESARLIRTIDLYVVRTHNCVPGQQIYLGEYQMSMSSISAARWRRGVLVLASIAAVIAGTACAPLIIGGAAVTAVTMAEDRRSTGTFVDDQSLEARALLKAKTRFGSSIHLNVTSFNRHVLLSGEVPDDATKQAVEQEVSSVGNIARIHNELVVGPNASVLSVSNDTRLTALVKTRYLEANRFQANHVKVVTEAATVFLMGIVKRNEAEAASQLASTTSGVRRVVMLFEYLD